MSTDNIQVWDGKFPAASKNSTFSGGTGTIGDPYIIGTALNFAQLSSDVAAGIEYRDTYFELGGSISLNLGPIDPALVDPTVPGPGGYPLVSSFPVYEWKPVGGADAVSTDPNLVHVFQGHFDGAGWTISNAYYNHQVEVAPAADDDIEHDPANLLNAVGLFGAIGTKSTIKGIKTTGGYFGACNSVGGIVGRSWGGEVSDCHNGNFIYATGSQGTGGVVGASWTFIPQEGDTDPQKSPLVDKCSNSGTIVSNYTKPAHGEHPAKRSGAAGGVVGENEGPVINSWNTGEVAALLNAAGIVGSNQSENSTGEITIDVPGEIYNCYNWGNIGTTVAYGNIPTVTADCAGGIIGYQTGSCENVYNKGVVIINASTETHPPVGQIIGDINSNPEGLTPEPQTNSNLFYLSGGSRPVGVGHTDSGGYSQNAYSQKSDLNWLLTALNTWVTNHNTQSVVYTVWSPDASDWPKF